MKMANLSADVRNCRFAACMVAGTLVLLMPLVSGAVSAVVVNDNPVGTVAPAVRFSAGVADIVKMVDAKVDTEVISTYIKNSPTAYNPSATEIIALKDHGVGAGIITAMLQRGAEVRAQAMRTASAAPAPSVPPAAPGAAGPYYDFSTQPAYPSYIYPASSYAYPAYSYANPVYYIGGYDYGNYWPSYGPAFSFGFYPYCGYGGRSFCSTGHHQPYGYGGRGYGYGYGGHSYYGGSVYNGGRSYYGGRGYYSTDARFAPYASRGGSFRSVNAGGRPTGFAGQTGGFRAASSSSGRAVGGFGGGRSMGGRSR
jgi:hypothetical protein